MDIVNKKELKELVGTQKGYRIQDSHVETVNEILSESGTPLKFKAGKDLLLRNFADFIQFLKSGDKLSDYARAIKFITYTEFIKVAVKDAHSYTFPETYHKNSPLAPQNKEHAPYAYRKIKMVQNMLAASLEELSTQYRPKRVELLDELHNIGLDVDVKPGTRINAIDSFLKHTTKMVDNTPKIDVNINNETHNHVLDEVYLNERKQMTAFVEASKQMLSQGSTLEDLGKLQFKVMEEEIIDVEEE